MAEDYDVSPRGRLYPASAAAAARAGEGRLDPIPDFNIGASVSGTGDEGDSGSLGDDAQLIPDFEGVGEHKPAGLCSPPASPLEPFGIKAPSTPMSSSFGLSPASHLRPPVPGAASRSPLLRALGRGAMLADRRPSAASIISNNSDRSRGSRQNASIIGLIRDLYIANLDMPRWNETEDVPEYETWPPEMDAQVRTLLKDVTEPPHEGMLDRADTYQMLQKEIAEASHAVQDVWRNVLKLYDVAMKGKVDALLALGDAQSKIYEQQQNATRAQEAMREESERNEDLHRTAELFEAENNELRQQIARLEERNQTLATASAMLETRCAELETAQQTQREVLEDVVAGWEPLDETAASRSPTGGRDDHDAWSQRIRDALDDARAAAVVNNARYRELQDRYDELKAAADEARKQPRLQGTLSRGNSGLELRVKELELRNQALKAELNAERALSLKRNQEDTQLMIDLPDQYAALERKLEQLKQKLDEQGAEAALAHAGYKQGVDSIETSVQYLHAMLARILGGLGRDPGLPPLPRNAQQPLLPTQVIRDMVDSQLKAVEVNRAVLDQLTARFDGTVERVSKEMAEVNATHVKQIQEFWAELERAIVAAEGLDEERKQAEKRLASVEREKALLQCELDALRQQAPSEWSNSKDIGEQASQPSIYIGAANATSQRSWRSQTSFLSSPGSHYSFRGLGHITFPGGEYEIEYLLGVRRLLAKLKADLAQMANEDSNDKDAKIAIRGCLNQLHIMLDGLKSLDPNTPTEDLIAAFAGFLEEHLANDSEIDLWSIQIDLRVHDMHFRALLKLEQYTSKPSDSEGDLLRGIEKKISAVQGLQMEQSRLLEQYETYRARRPDQPLSSRRSREAVRLVGTFLEKAGDTWSLQAPAGREGTAAMAQCIAQIQQLTADSFMEEKRRELQDGIRIQEVQLAELEQKRSRIMKLVALGRRQLEAFHRLQKRPGNTASKVDERWKVAFKAHIDRHERELLREHVFFGRRIQQLDEKRAKTQAFLDSEAASDRHRAEQILTETLLRIQASALPSQHGEAACFCTLLRCLFPRIYYSTVKGGCCAGGRTAPSGAEKTISSEAILPSSCHGHHGHGALSMSWGPWISICRILTSFAWLLMLVLVQPSNVFATIAFLLSIPLGLPGYIYRLASYALSYTYFHIRRLLLLRRFHTSLQEAESQEEDAQKNLPQPRLQPPKLDWPHQIPPPASTMVGSAVTLLLAYAWLSYVAVLAERRIWMADNDWRYAYVADLTAAKASCPTYLAWSPVRVDYRLVTQPLWVWFSEGVHRLFEWKRPLICLLELSAT
ncbi:hypothetical protein N657DRAFT_632830 [Parathielavia appendiculata]|uniref:Uncharacterized protein n=1 Tax=Parathielavia appendiculata TaxID=2587402 RepID=A0AAN6U1X8_9PEZI|nr:hypothetical protein N657DRAFT_632830 [Parathielavia appendiculata]